VLATAAYEGSFQSSQKKTNVQRWGGRLCHV